MFKYIIYIKLNAFLRIGHLILLLLYNLIKFLIEYDSIELIFCLECYPIQYCKPIL